MVWGVKIGDLSEETGVSVASIKYYVREGLLPPGERMGRNAVSYDRSHARRLRLIRALREIGGLPVEVIRSVLETADDRDKSLHQVLGAVQRSLASADVGAVLATARAVGHPDVGDLLPHYRRAAADLAVLEVEWLGRRSSDVFDVAERGVVGTILGDALLAAVRREEQRATSRKAFATQEGHASESI
jgi:DNA-binding transcriptional MerR regulator